MYKCKVIVIHTVHVVTTTVNYSTVQLKMFMYSTVYDTTSTRAIQ